MVEKTGELLTAFHKANPIASGMEKEEFKSRILDSFYLKDYKKGDVILNELIKRGTITTSESTVAVAGGGEVGGVDAGGDALLVGPQNCLVVEIRRFHIDKGVDEFQHLVHIESRRLGQDILFVVDGIDVVGGDVYAVGIGLILQGNMHGHNVYIIFCNQRSV